MRVYLRLVLSVIIGCGSAVTVFSQSSDTSDPLVRVLQTKGIITDAEARAITSNASASEQRDRLAVILRDKGVISATEFEAIRAPAASAEIKTITAEYARTTTDARCNRRNRASSFTRHRFTETRRTDPRHKAGQWRAPEVLRHLQNQHRSRLIIAAGKRFPVTPARAGHWPKQLA